MIQKDQTTYVYLFYKATSQTFRFRTNSGILNSKLVVPRLPRNSIVYLKRDYQEGLTPKTISKRNKKVKLLISMETCISKSSKGTQVRRNGLSIRKTLQPNTSRSYQIGKQRPSLMVCTTLQHQASHI